MTAAELYRRLTLPARARVMGYKLVPYTVGHAILFDRIGVTDISSWTDLIVAVKLCSMSAKDAERWIASPFRRWLTWQWVRWTKLRFITDPAHVEAGMKVFGEYLEEWTKYPRYKAAQDNDGRPCGSPPAQMLRVTLMSRLGYSPESIDSTSYLRAVWDYLTWMEQEGHIHIEQDNTDDEEAEIQRMADEFAKRVAAKEAK